jgi:hypothetical protein
MFGYEEVNWKEVAAELWHGFRHLSPQKVWDWLTDGFGVRLIAAASIALVLWLSGCASAGPAISGTEHAVTINWANSSSSATLADAEEHCAKYGRHAQFSGKPNAFTDAYNCVKE